MEELQATQETLRGFMLALFAAVPAIDRARFATALTAAAEHPGISDAARAMLNDLAAGATALAPARTGRN